MKDLIKIKVGDDGETVVELSAKAGESLRISIGLLMHSQLLDVGLDEGDRVVLSYLYDKLPRRS